MDRTFRTQYSSRRALLRAATAAAGAALLAACTRGRSTVPASAPPQPRRDATAPSPPPNTTLVVSARAAHADRAPVRGAEFGIVGVFDVDWLTDPGFTRLLDNLAASPRAFRGVRFFGALNSGTRERATPDGSGGVWPDPAAPPDFSATLAALDALTARGLVPFVQLSFFPAAVSPAPIVPPASWDRWRSLVRAFLDTLARDPRFGEGAMRDWWFEVWNEPNIPVFWQGTFDQYRDCYRATAAAVREAGYAIRLGGPALAYLPASDGPAAGAPLMRRFLQFLHDEPDVPCDFLSFHQKGTWTDTEPALDDLTAAAEEVAAMARAIDPARFRDLPIINDEADEKIGFDTPYAPRMDERNAAWLCAVAIAHDALTERMQDTGLRFLAAADNANLQLVQAPFDGRRAIMTRASTMATTDLLKIPAYNWYELLALLGDTRGAVMQGGEMCYPATDLFHLMTIAPTHLSALFTIYPRGAASGPRTVEYTITDIPWPVVNIARFQIDGTRSNGFAAAGARLSPALDPARIGAIRQAQELALFAPPRHAVPITGGAFIERFTIAPFTTLLYWITPYAPDVPAAPAWLHAERDGDTVVLRWEPDRSPSFASYEVLLLDGGGPGTRLSPDPLRAALWVDTAPPRGPRTYGVRAVSASGIAGPMVMTSPES